MATLLKWVGGIWAILGGITILNFAMSGGSSTINAWGVIFSMLIYVFPGLVLAGIGYVIEGKIGATQSSDDLPLGIENWKLGDDESDRDKHPVQPRSYLGALFRILPLAVLFCVIGGLILNVEGSGRESEVWKEIWWGAVIGLLVSLVGAAFLKGQVILVSFQDEQAFLERLKVRLAKDQYNLTFQTRTLLIFEPSSRFAVISDEINVQLRENSATIVGPKVILRALRKMHVSIPSEQKGQDWSLNHQTVKPSVTPLERVSAETRLQELRNLLDKGLITTEEYERKRAEILNAL